MRLGKLQEAVHMMERAAGNVFPCGVLLVAKGDDVLVHEGVGEIEGRSCPTDTVFDLASLTKPLCTVALAMLAVQRGAVDLDAPVGRFLPWLRGTDKEGLSLLQLLGHKSGLPAWRPYGEELLRSYGTEIAGSAVAKQHIREALRNEPLEAPPGTRAVYSDLGYMLLGFVLEVVFGAPLDEAFERLFAGPLGLRCLRFRRVSSPAPSNWKTVAPTEVVPWRGGVVRALVHDDNAFVLGGVAGHAGLFGTALDVYIALREMWRAHSRGSGNVLEGWVVRLFWDRRHLGQSDTWLLGFDTPDREGSSAGPLPPEGLIGHLGFTGTSFWLHVPSGAMVVLLTNRVHPTRRNEKIRRFRPLLHQACFSALGIAKSPPSRAQR